MIAAVLKINLVFLLDVRKKNKNRYYDSNGFVNYNGVFARCTQ